MRFFDADEFARLARRTMKDPSTTGLTERGLLFDAAQAIENGELVSAVPPPGHDSIVREIAGILAARGQEPERVEAMVEREGGDDEFYGRYVAEMVDNIEDDLMGGPADNSEPGAPGNDDRRYDEEA